MRVRRAQNVDCDFLSEMARLACGLDGRPLPSPDDPLVLALLPRQNDPALVALDDREHRVGATWLHDHEPPLVVDERGQPSPEVTMAVREDARGRGIGGLLLEELVVQATERCGALALNVHLRNPAARLYMRGGFKVAGKGRGWYGVAMVRRLDEPA